MTHMVKTSSVNGVIVAENQPVRKRRRDTVDPAGEQLTLFDPTPFTKPPVAEPDFGNEEAE